MSNFQIIQEGNRCILRIKSVFPEDAGIFTCRATNPAGVAESSAELFVVGKWSHLVCSMQRCDWLCKITWVLCRMALDKLYPHSDCLLLNEEASVTDNASLHDMNKWLFDMWKTCLFLCTLLFPVYLCDFAMWKCVSEMACHIMLFLLNTSNNKNYIFLRFFLNSCY